MSMYRNGMAPHKKLRLSWPRGSDFVTIITVDREVTVKCGSLFFGGEGGGGTPYVSETPCNSEYTLTEK